MSLSTSLAFYDESTNLDIFRRIQAAPRRNGTFFFDQGNIFWLVKNHVPERYSLNVETCVVSGRYAKHTAEGRIESGWDLRFYHLPELKWMLSSLGFAFIGSLGDFDGSASTYASRRLTTIWRKV